MNQPTPQPFTPRHILVAEVEQGHYNIIVDGVRFGDRLATDEVIGAFAAEILHRPSHAKDDLKAHSILWHEMKAKWEADAMAKTLNTIRP